MSMIAAFCLVVIVLLIGEVISTRTRAFVPSVFVSAIIFLLGFWTFFPSDLINKSGMGMPMVLLAMYLLITHMGTIMSLKELIGQWKTIVVALGGLAGICLGTMTIGKALFGWPAVVAATPPLTGGVVASIIMSQAASEKGLADLAVLAVIMYVMKGFVGYPITALCLKKEATRLLEEYRSIPKDGLSATQQEVAATEVKPERKIIPSVPPQYNTPYMHLAKLGVVAWIAVSAAQLTNDVVSPFVLCLVCGVIAAEIGFLDRKPLNASGSFGFLMTALMAFIFAGLGKATPEMLIKLVIPLVGMIALGVIGMGIIAVLIGTRLGYTKEMSFAVALTAFYGFPPNYVLTEEAANVLVKTPDEKEYLMNDMLPKMLVGGFTTVTVVSVVIASVFARYF